MIGEIKYCKFCNKEKPIKEFVKSGFAIKNICRECQNKKQTQIYRDSKKVKELEKQIQKYKEVIDKLNKLTDVRLLTMYFEDGGEMSVLPYEDILNILEEVE